jgi:hypothetical protein
MIAEPATPLQVHCQLCGLMNLYVITKQEKFIVVETKKIDIKHGSL